MGGESQHLDIGPKSPHRQQESVQSMGSRSTDLAVVDGSAARYLGWNGFKINRIVAMANELWLCMYLVLQQKYNKVQLLLEANCSSGRLVAKRHGKLSSRPGSHSLAGLLDRSLPLGKDTQELHARVCQPGLRDLWVMRIVMEQIAAICQTMMVAGLCDMCNKIVVMAALCEIGTQLAQIARMQPDATILTRDCDAIFTMTKRITFLTGIMTAIKEPTAKLLTTLDCAKMREALFPSPFAEDERFLRAVLACLQTDYRLLDFDWTLLGSTKQICDKVRDALETNPPTQEVRDNTRALLNWLSEVVVKGTTADEPLLQQQALEALTFAYNTASAQLVYAAAAGATDLAPGMFAAPVCSSSNSSCSSSSRDSAGSNEMLSSLKDSVSEEVHSLFAAYGSAPVTSSNDVSGPGPQARGDMFARGDTSLLGANPINTDICRYFLLPEVLKDASQVLGCLASKVNLGNCEWLGDAAVRHEFVRQMQAASELFEQQAELVRQKRTQLLQTQPAAEQGGDDDDDVELVKTVDYIDLTAELGEEGDEPDAEVVHMCEVFEAQVQIKKERLSQGSQE